MKYGVIDLGTNTFHLLIAEAKSNRQLNELYRERVFIKLAENGIETIGNAPYQRAITALRNFKKVLDKFQIEKVKAIGTAALRTASNGKTFIEQVKKELGIEIELISGTREAILIHKGVMQAVPIATNNDFLIMDIGGGSVEFILANTKGVVWAESFPIGAAVLYKKFHRQNPITSEEVLQLHQFLDMQLIPLFKIIEKHPVANLIGSAGTFDVIEVNLVKEKIHPLYGYISIEGFKAFYQKVVPTTFEQRLKMAAIPNVRADMIVVALILIDYIVNKIDIKSITVSTYSMKEGVLGELISNNL